jgi:hypothetical protein
VNSNHRLLAGVPMTRNERRLGRYIRDAEGHPSGPVAGQPNPAPSANNPTGNQTDSSGTGTGDANNNGQRPELAAFWESPAAGATGGTPSGDSASSGTPAAGQPTNQPGGPQQEGQDFGRQLAERITALTFQDLFTPEAAAQIAEGNFTGINGGLQNLGRETVRQSIAMNVQLMQRFGEGMIARVQSMIQDSLGGRDNEQTLLEAFPSARDPAARPLIQSVFDQALKHTGGDRVKAVTLARDMLKIVGSTAAADFGLNTPPAAGEDTYGGQGESRLVQELLSRG